MKINDSGVYEKDFPYLSLCGKERNFVRCDDLPIVFTNLQTRNGKSILIYNYCEPKTIVEFQPNKLYMGISTGRVYHPGPESLHGIGLIKSQLAIELSKGFRYICSNDGPTHFEANDELHRLDYTLKENLLKLGRKEY